MTTRTTHLILQQLWNRSSSQRPSRTCGHWWPTAGKSCRCAGNEAQIVQRSVWQRLAGVGVPLPDCKEEGINQRNSTEQPRQHQELKTVIMGETARVTKDMRWAKFKCILINDCSNHGITPVCRRRRYRLAAINRVRSLRDSTCYICYREKFNIASASINIARLARLPNQLD